MKKKGELPDLTWIWITRGYPPGLGAFEELVKAAKENRAPSPGAVREIAEASTELFAEGPARKRLERFGRRLGMFIKQGKGRKPDDSAGTVARRKGVIADLIVAERRFRAEGMNKRNAHSRAISEVLEHWECGERTLNRWEGELRAEVEAWISAVEDGSDPMVRFWLQEWRKAPENRDSEEPNFNVVESWRHDKSA